MKHFAIAAAALLFTTGVRAEAGANGHGGHWIRYPALFGHGGFAPLWDDAFFAQTRDRPGRHHSRIFDYERYPRPSGGVDIVNGQVRYRYDRDYPYDYRAIDRYADRHERRAPRCRTEWVQNSAGADAPVRVCSGFSG